MKRGSVKVTETIVNGRIKHIVSCTECPYVYNASVKTDARDHARYHRQAHDAGRVQVPGQRVLL